MLTPEACHKFTVPHAHFWYSELSEVYRDQGPSQLCRLHRDAELLLQTSGCSLQALSTTDALSEWIGWNGLQSSAPEDHTEIGINQYVERSISALCKLIKVGRRVAATSLYSSPGSKCSATLRSHWSGPIFFLLTRIYKTCNSEILDGR